MGSTQPALFAAGHGFYQFALSRSAFDRSLYYNLLLQPALAIPDHYFLQGEWLGDHLNDYPGRDSWIESGLRNGFIAPYFRRDASGLVDLLALMEGSDRRGFGRRAKDIAERLDRVPFQAAFWSSTANSASFGTALRHYLSVDEPPMMEFSVDPDEFAGFWSRSREWVASDLDNAGYRSSAVLGSEGVLLSQLLQVVGERVLGADCGRIRNIDELLSRAGAQVGRAAERDLRVYFTSMCELYNRSLADTILTAPNSPRWERHVAAMDLWREDVLTSSAPAAGGAPGNSHLDVEIRLPRPRHLRAVSGDVLTAIRRSPACERYFESLSHWQSEPDRNVLKDELVASLQRYGREIMTQVGEDVGAWGLRPQFISKATDLSRVLEKAPGVVQGFLAVGASATSASAATGTTSPAVPSALFSLFVLQTVVKHYVPSEPVEVNLAPLDGARIHADVTISRA